MIYKAVVTVETSLLFRLSNSSSGVSSVPPPFLQDIDNLCDDMITDETKIMLKISSIFQGVKKVNVGKF